MNQFFSATEVHIDDKCLIDATDQTETPILVSLGIDNVIYRLSIEDGKEERYNLEHETTYDAMALAPDATHCLIGGTNNAVLQFNFENSTTVKLLETMGNITALKYAPSGKYIAIGSEEGKCIIYEPHTGRKQKCRPGHIGAICSVSLSKSGNFLSSIGKDQNVLIYRIGQTDQPREVAKFPITKLENCADLTSSFNFSEAILFVSGGPQLQRLDCIQNRWEYSKSKTIAHSAPIIMVQAVKPNTLVTSSYQQVCIWNIKTEEKLFEIEQLNLTRVVPVAGKFYGSRNDGRIYGYKREIREQEPMDIEQESANDRIQFDDEQPADKSGEEEEEEEIEQRKEIEYHQHKKTKVDKMITCFPQQPITTATSFFEGSRFLYVNLYGCVIERQGGGDQKTIEFVNQAVTKKSHKFSLTKNKSYSFFSLNELGLVYANQKQFGFHPSSETNHEEWEAEWHGIQAVALGSGWIAIANDGQVKILDMASHEIHCIAFDRQLVALRAFQNILVMVYHESVPLWGSQQLAMQLFLINNRIRQVNIIANTHVPLKPESHLHWFDFSKEGMLFSQDSTRITRAFSLETSQWTRLSLDGIEEIKKVWVIGVKNYSLQYWKTSDVDPQPTVAPRFDKRQSGFSIPTVGGHPEGAQDLYQKLLWNRYVLDHQKARNRLWGHLKCTRAPNNLFRQLSETILNQKQITKGHMELDEKYFPLIDKYLKAKQKMRAILMAQNCLRTLQASRKLVDLFDFENQRSLAIQFEEHCDQRQKEVEYESCQIFQFIKLREEAERCIKPRFEDPMRRTATRKITESIPTFSQNFTSSQESMELSSQKLNTSRISQNSQNSQPDNPFLKKKSNHQSIDAKKKQISDHIEKYGIKHKADKKIVPKNISK